MAKFLFVFLLIGSITKAPYTRLRYLNDRGSNIYLNGQLIPPSLEAHRTEAKFIPFLFDEGYEFRPPVAAPVKKGWHTVLVTLPVGSLKRQDWQNPVKWMSTLLPLCK
ncbi:hypothetical protein MKJ04_12780 [Pontibacter sp. E15-1]|uniref:hypothetical protein n=1 Tax=Pontibacter sp. E15-1 TaxID=2919918 RepID=UPI001F503AC6|nr:hypothetical protein [Pontibacter sp. E15-1]MCJ8165720.1 hypothetical protein [Pontibacter sp. E15-1]